MIICAAIRYTFIDEHNNEDSVMICGYRHGDCINIWGKHIEPHVKEKIQEVQGFMTDKGDFLDRISGRKHFVECGQGVPEHGDELYSEDLY